MLKYFLNLENLGANFSSTNSLKKTPTRKYKSVAPMVVDVTTKKIPHHLPKTKPANINIGSANPKNNIQTIQKIKNVNVKNKKFSFLYFKIISLFDLINS